MEKWRLEHPHDTPPYPFTPSPTSAYSSYLAWAALFAYFLADDAYSIHEQLGRKVQLAFDLAPALTLRGQDFGELAVSLSANSVLLGAIAFLY